MIEPKRTGKLRLIAFAAMLPVAGCAAPMSEPPSYELPSSDEASVQPAIIEGTRHVRFDVEQSLRRIAFRQEICAYPFTVNGQSVGLSADCTAAIPIVPGKQTIVARVDGVWFPVGGNAPGGVVGRPPSDKLAVDGPSSFPVLKLHPGQVNLRRQTATLIFDAMEGHSYKIALTRIYLNRGRFRTDVWINDETTQSPVTAAKLVTSPTLNWF